jgi:hypothetical protein
VCVCVTQKVRVLMCCYCVAIVLLMCCSCVANVLLMCCSCVAMCDTEGQGADTGEPDGEISTQCTTIVGFFVPQ